MARVLAITSHVAYGSVGLAAVATALRALGHEVAALPTVLLSNHPGHPRVSGVEIAPATLDGIMDSLAGNGWLPSIDAVLTGYLPTPRHVASARAAVERVRAANPSAFFLCDPVFGDDPHGIYLDKATAAALRDRLVPLCDLATPNRFELAWLSGVTVEAPAGAADAARRLGPPAVIATSVPAGDATLASVLVEGEGARACRVARRAHAPHGTGDLLAALYLGHLLNGERAEACLGRAAAAVEASILASAGADELSLAGAADAWRSVRALPAEAI